MKKKKDKKIIKKIEFEINDKIVFRNGVITVLESRKIEDFCQIFRIILHNSSSVARMREKVEGEARERWRGRG